MPVDARGGTEERRFEELRGGVALAELGGHGDGPYCARHGAGAALVILGTYIVDAGASVPYDPRFVFRPGRKNYEGYLKEHVAAARQSCARVAVSVVSVERSDSVDFLQAAQDAGADYASLCLYSTMEMFASKGVSSELCRPESFDRLSEWTSAIVGGVDIPTIFKMGISASTDPAGTVDTIADAGGPIVHVDVGHTSTGSSGLAWLGQLKGRCEFLIAGGGVRNVEGARRALTAGADAVAVATAAMKDPNLCGRIQLALRDR